MSQASYLLLYTALKLYPALGEPDVGYEASHFSYPMPTLPRKVWAPHLVCGAI